MRQVPSRTRRTRLVRRRRTKRQLPLLPTPPTTTTMVAEAQIMTTIAIMREIHTIHPAAVSINSRTRFLLPIRLKIMEILRIHKAMGDSLNHRPRIILRHHRLTTLRLLNTMIRNQLLPTQVLTTMINILPPLTIPPPSNRLIQTRILNIRAPHTTTGTMVRIVHLVAPFLRASWRIHRPLQARSCRSMPQIHPLFYHQHHPVPA